MPLLNKRPFKPVPLPEELLPDDQVFYCPLTKEVFRDYEEFFQRAILLNSLVWSCGITGKSGLTFEEALESEQNAQDSIDSLPDCLEKAIGCVALLSRRSKFDDLLADLWEFLSNHYTPQEIVEVVTEDGIKKPCIVVEGKYHDHEAGTSDSGVSTGMKDDDRNPEQQLPHASSSAASYSYCVKLMRPNPDDAKELSPFWTTCDRIARKKSTLSKSKLKLYLKAKTDLVDGILCMKSSTYLPSELKFEKLFVGPRPKFKVTAHSSKDDDKNGTVDVTKAKQRKKDSQKKDKIKDKKNAKQGKKKSKHNNALDQGSSCDGTPLSKLKITDEMTVEQREEMKRRIKEEHDKEREKVRNEKRNARQSLLEWKKSRDDLMCDDLKPLPVFDAVCIPEGFSGNDFGRCIAVLQFFHSFAEFMGEGDVLGNLGLDKLYKILLDECDSVDLVSISSVVCSLLRSIFNYQEHEDGDEISSQNITEVEDTVDLSNRDFGPAIIEAGVIMENFLKCNDCLLRYMTLNSDTVAELLRMHLLTSGYYPGRSVSRWRFENRGNYRCWDDPGFRFRKQHSELISKLSRLPLHSLGPGERLDVLELLCSQLLMFGTVRDEVDTRLEQVKLCGIKWKQLLAVEQRREKEAVLAKQRVIQREKQAANTTGTGNADESTGNVLDAPAAADVEKEKLLLSRMLEDAHRVGSLRREQFRYDSLDINFDLLSRDDIDQARELQREFYLAEEKTLLDEIGYAQNKAGVHCLGLDRAFRKYWVVTSIPAILVEQSQLCDMNECQEYATPINRVDVAAELDRSLNELQILELISGCAGVHRQMCCPVHGQGAQSSANSWRFVRNVEQLDMLVDALNKRGFRETDLLNNMKTFKSNLVYCVSVSPNALSTPAGPSLVCPDGEAGTQSLEANTPEHRLITAILGIEERVQTGSFGALQVNDRMAWRAALERGEFEPNCDRIVVNGHRTMFREQLLHKSRTEQLALALLQVAQGVAPKNFKKSFVASASKEDAEDATEESDCVCNGNTQPKKGFDLWQTELLKATSISQIFVCAIVLERNIVWSRGHQPKCKMCRRRGDWSCLVACAKCTRVYHPECLRPPLKEVPRTEWSCKSCNSAAGKKRSHASVDEENEDGLDTSRLNGHHKNGDVNDDADDDESSDTEMGADGTTRNTEATRLALCGRLLDEVQAHHDAWPFNRSVSKKQVPDYYEVIKNPMDFGTMQKKLARHEYNSYREVLADAELVFQNCRTYNSPNDAVFECGNRLERFMQEQIIRIGLTMSTAILPARKRKRIIYEDD